MSAFTPQVPPLPSVSPAERLGRFVPSALRRTPPVAKLWSLPRLLATGLVTAGYVPCLALHTRVRRVQMMHALQIERAADLLAEHLPADDAAEVRAAAGRVRQPHAWTGSAIVATAVSLALLIAWLAPAFRSAAIGRVWLYPLASGEPLLVWAVVLLTVAYFLVLVPINRQITALEQFALAFNATAGERAGPLSAPSQVWGLRPVHAAAGGLLAVCGPFWCLPMCLGWGALDAFATGPVLRFRVQLADRLQTLAAVESVVPPGDLCPHADCRGPVPQDARFCPRCGRPVVRAAVTA